MDEGTRSRLLGWWSSVVSRRPGWVLFIGSAMVLASIAVTIQNLRFESDRNRLICDDLAWNERFNDWRRSFGGKDDLVIVVDTYHKGHPLPKHRASAERLVTELAVALKADVAHVRAVVWGFDPHRISPKALRTQNWTQFTAQISRFEQAQPLLDSPRPMDLVARVESMFGPQAIFVAGGAQPESIAELSQVFDAFHEVLVREPDRRPDLQSLIQTSHEQRSAWRYLESQPDGRLLFIRVTPQVEATKINALAASISSIRAIMKDVGSLYPNVEFGMTGLEAVEAEETAAVMRDSTIASIVALVLIGLLLIFAFYSWRTPLFMLVALLYGVTWTFGYLTVVVGHLQVISVVFCVILLGLGIGYGIHLASRFELVRHHYPDGPEGFAPALRDTLTTMGPGVFTGATTTAAAFVTTIFTDFTGVAEMGLIASGGIMLCLLSMFSVFPALLRLFKPGHKHFRPMHTRWFHFFEDRWLMPFVRWPYLTLTIAGVLTLVSLLAISQMRFNYDLMELQPRGIESVRWQQRIARYGGRSIYAAVCIVESHDDARRLTARLRKLDTVQDVGGIGLLFPEDDDRKCKRLGEARMRLAPAIDRILRFDTLVSDRLGPPTADQSIGLLKSLSDTVKSYKMLVMLSPELWPHYQDLSIAIDRVLGTLQSLPPVQRVARLAQLEREYDAWRRQTAATIEAALDTRLLQFDDLPQDLMRPYRDEHGRLALEVYPDNQRFGYSSPLHPEFMPLLIRELHRTITNLPPSADSVRNTVAGPALAGSVLTGPLIQFYQSGQLILDSYRIAGALALLIVLLLVLVDFQHLGNAVLALVPVGVGFAITFGVMRVLGLSLNPANIIVLPLMFGIGVDSGVHVLHRFRQDNRTRPLGMTDGTGKGVTITSLTTMVGFGALMLARHRGIFGLGLVMTLGIGFTMVACLTVMPAWLELRQRHERRGSTDGAEPSTLGDRAAGKTSLATHVTSQVGAGPNCSGEKTTKGAV